jgi:hypothetical protein
MLFHAVLRQALLVPGGGLEPETLRRGGMVSISRSTGSIRDNIMFFSMARHLTNGRAFAVWLAKLWEFDPGLTIKFMRRHGDEFTPECISRFNDLLTMNGKERFHL